MPLAAFYFDKFYFAQVTAFYGPDRYHILCRVCGGYFYDAFYLEKIISITRMIAYSLWVFC
jgi:hypothetical protein